MCYDADMCSVCGWVVVVVVAGEAAAGPPHQSPLKSTSTATAVAVIPQTRPTSSEQLESAGCV